MWCENADEVSARSSHEQQPTQNEPPNCPCSRGWPLSITEQPSVLQLRVILVRIRVQKLVRRAALVQSSRTAAFRSWNDSAARSGAAKTAGWEGKKRASCKISFLRHQHAKQSRLNSITGLLSSWADTDASWGASPCRSSTIFHRDSQLFSRLLNFLKIKTQNVKTKFEFFFRFRKVCSPELILSELQTWFQNYHREPSKRQMFLLKRTMKWIKDHRRQTQAQRLIGGKRNFKWKVCWKIVEEKFVCLF